jgi:4-amino-4-deoxy-L-arabinose transferase-like glycosyltransferase
VAVPDAYRSPGFPWLLALCMRVGPDGGWYALALQCQVLLGTVTVTATMLLARRWLATLWSVFAGLLLALWPHHIAATGTLLSEVVFGWALTCGLLAYAAASEGRRNAAALAGIAFGYAYLVNPLIALFPFVLAALLWRDRRRRASLVFLAVFLLPVLAFAARNLTLPASSAPPPAGRAVMNFVQGSWPQYHQAWLAQTEDPAAVATLQAINRDIATMTRRPVEGARQVVTRMAGDPGLYAGWYLLHKPMLLWEWDIRIGLGGPYVLDVRNSPLERNPLLGAIGRGMRAATPVLTLGLFAAAFVLLAGGLRHRAWAPQAAIATAALALYLTGIHDVFQAEPRYANAYRGLEALLVATALQLGMRLLTAALTRATTAVRPAGSA